MSDSRNADEDKLSLETEEPERLPAGKATLEDNASEERSAEGETAAAAPTVEQLLQKVEELQQQYDREHELNLLTVAELRNYQRRIGHQQAQQFQYAAIRLEPYRVQIRQFVIPRVRKVFASVILGLQTLRRHHVVRYRIPEHHKYRNNLRIILFEY